MKVSQELKDEFEKLYSERSIQTISDALEVVHNQIDNGYGKLGSFLFKNDTFFEDNENQLQFAKWWTGVEKIKVEEELYYLKLPFEEGREYITLDPYDGKIYPSDKMEINRFQTKFTAEEIENNEKLRQFEKFKKRVDDDD